MDNDSPTLTAAQLMRTAIATFTPETPIASAVDAMLEKGMHAAPVVDVAQRVVGMLAERECLLALCTSAYHATPSGTVADYMCREVLAIPPTTDLLRLAFLLHEDPLRSLPVVDDEGRLRGLVTRLEVLQGLNRARRARRRPRALPSTWVLMEQRRAKGP